MTLRECLEEEKERLLARLSAAEDMAAAASACEDAFGRVLIRYQEAEPEEETAAEAAHAMSLVRAAMPLLDSVGEIREYELKTGEADGKGRRPVLGILTAFLLAGAGIVCEILSRAENVPEFVMYVGIGLAAAGVLAAFLAGHKSGSARAKAPVREVKRVARPDAERVWRLLTAVAAVADKNLEETRERQKIARLDAAQQGGPLPERELDLLAKLLETSSEAQSEETQQISSDIRFYLHQNGVEAVPYTEEKRNWFDVMPGDGPATVRPALVYDGRLLKKGLAAGV